VPTEFLFRGHEKNIPSAWNSIGIKKICRMDLLQYSFFQHALWGSLLTAIACGLVGTYIVSRRLVFISGGITHASFGGLGLGFYLGMNPILMALVFSVLSAFGVEWISRSQDIREDSAIAGVWSLGMALGVIFIFLTPGYAPNLSAYLFGNILTISTTDLWGMGILALLLVALFGLFLREIVYVAFDRNFELTQGMPVRLIEYAMMFCIAVTIVLAIRLVGIMLLMSLLTLPQITINLLTSDFKKIMLGSIALGFLGCIVGLFLSYYLNVPSGAFIILVLVLSFLIVKAIKAFQMR
jgi:zinc transport system permease protein